MVMYSPIQNKYWLGTNIDTLLIFLSDSKKVKKLCRWNWYKSSNNITITECSNDEMDYLQVGLK